MIFFETSAKSGNNINNAFNSSINVIHNNIKNCIFDEDELGDYGIRIEKNGEFNNKINMKKMGKKNNNDCCKM